MPRQQLLRYRGEQTRIGIRRRRIEEIAQRLDNIAEESAGSFPRPIAGVASGPANKFGKMRRRLWFTGKSGSKRATSKLIA
jgi:hypothetical protein